MTTRKSSPSASAREAEAEDGFVTLEQCGVTLRIGVGENLPGAVIDAYMDGGTFANWKALKAMLGDEQWRRLIEAGATQGQLQELDKKIGELAGN